MSRIKIYCDGSSIDQGLHGGWGAVIITRHKGRKSVYEVRGWLHDTTNSKAELTAAISALFRLKPSTRPYSVEVVSDSAYLVNAFEKGWIYKWINNGWIKSNGETVKNQEHWETLLALVEIPYLHVSFRHVLGHNGDHWNERADYLATLASQEAKKGEQLEEGNVAKDEQVDHDACQYVIHGPWRTE